MHSLELLTPFGKWVSCTDQPIPEKYHDVSNPFVTCLVLECIDFT